MSAAGSSSDSDPIQCKRNMKIGGYNSAGLSPNIGVTVENGKIVNLNTQAMFAIPLDSPANLLKLTDTHDKPTVDINKDVKVAIAKMMEKMIQDTLDAIKDQQGEQVPDGDYKCYPSEMTYEIISKNGDVIITRTDTNEANMGIVPIGH